MEWNIKYLEYTNDSDKGVIKVLYSATLTDGDYTFVESGRQEFTPDPSASDYIAYEDLTEAIVVGWLESAIGTQVQESLQAKINAAKNPTTMKGKPW